jgi:putative SOS response-associated peptidase YedK
MCGRFMSGADDYTWSEYCRVLRLPTATPAPTRGERSPGQAIAVLRAVPEKAARELAELRWGLLPHWVTDRKKAPKLINVRSETAHKKFARYLERHRCVIPAAGFFEWSASAPGERKTKFLIRDLARPILSLAGLWSLWTGPDGEAVETCTILTTEPNALVRPIHDRMPAILDEAVASAWLEPDRDARELGALLAPHESATMVAEPEGAPPPPPRGPSQGELF